MRFVLVLLLLGVILPAQTMPVEKLVYTLDGRYNSMHSWQADFVQIYTSGLKSRSETGHLYLQKPGRMRWDYLRPVKKVFLVNGQQVWQYIDGDREATLTKIQDSGDLRTPLRFLLGHIDLPKELDQLSYSGRKPLHAGDSMIYGKPKPQEAGAWREVWIEITPAYEIDRLIITAVDGSQNDIRLSRIEPNSKMPAGIFDFTPPPGVRVAPGN